MHRTRSLRVQVRGRWLTVESVTPSLHSSHRGVVPCMCSSGSKHVAVRRCVGELSERGGS